MSKPRVSSTVYYVPTLVDDAGLRHIIPGKDSAAYCGATGAQHFPHDHKATELCQRCVQKYVKVIFGDKLKEFGL